MEELEALQNEFKKLQSQTAAFRLSERSVVEILMHLTAKGKLSVLHTMNGKELVTPEKLEIEIMDELIAHRGRINLTDLQPLLNIDLSHIERKVADLVKKDSQYRLIEGEIISNLYLDSVAEEINETIQSKGELHVTDLSRRFGLSSEFLQELIERRLGKQIKARMEGQMLYTDDFIKRQEAQIRGLFSAVTRPTPVAALFARGSFHEGLFDTILEELISEGRLSGSVMGRRERAQYVPNIYNQARQAWIESFFAQNGFVEYSTLAKAQIENPQKFLKSHYPSGIALDNFFVADGLLIVIDSSVGEAIRGDSWVDVTTLAPTMFSVSDCSALLMACPSLKAATAAGTASNLPKRKEREREREREKEKEAAEGKSTSAYTQSAHCNTTILNNIFVVSRGFLERCVRLFEQKIEVDVRENAAAAKAPPPASGEEDEEVEEPAPTKKGRKGRQQVQEDDEPPSKGKGRRAAGKGGKKRGGDGGGKIRGGARGEQTSNAEDDGADQEKLVSWLREGFGEECPEELLEAVAEHLRSIASDIRQAVSKSIFKDTIANQRKQYEQFLNEFDARYADILLFHHGAQAFATETGEDDEGLLEKHLLRTLCTDVVNSLIQNQALHHFIECEAIRSPSDRAQIISQLPPKVAKPLDRLVKALSAKSSVEQFLEELDASSGVFQLQLKKLDKKRERQLIFSHRQAMLEQLQKQTNPIQVLHLVLLLLYLKNFSAPIHCPGRAAGLLIRVLSTKIHPEAAQQLQEFHRLVVERIQYSGLTESNESTSSEQEPSLTESTETTEDAEVLEKVSALKQLVQDKKKATD